MEKEMLEEKLLEAEVGDEEGDTCRGDKEEDAG